MKTGPGRPPTVRADPATAWEALDAGSELRTSGSLHTAHASRTAAMPTENERKYVLSDAKAVRALWDDADWSEIRQGYLTGDGRIRRQTGMATCTTPSL